MPEWYTCKAGFKHQSVETCTHVIAQPKGTAAPRDPQRYRLPRDHNTVVIDGNNRVIRTYRHGPSDEELAEIRAANRERFRPRYEVDRDARLAEYTKKAADAAPVGFFED